MSNNPRLPVTLFLLAFFSSLSAPSLLTGADRDYWPTKGWWTCSPEQQGIDAEMSARIGSYVKESCPALSSLLVIRHGYVVFEEYYNGNKDDLRNIMSATKSVMSILIGIALKQGLLESVDQKLTDFFPEFVGIDSSSGARNISLRHLLTMTAGLSDVVLDPKKLADRFRQGFFSEPGPFAYCNTNHYLLSMIVTKVAGMKASDFAKKFLFKPLGIDRFRWDSLYGYSIGASDLQLSCRDFAKIAYLYLNEGRWDEEQIVAPEWVAQSTLAVVDARGEYYTEYGYSWWIKGLGGHPAYFGWGAGGQYIYILPDLDIIVTTNGTFDTIYDDIVEKYVIPAVRN